jgi:hypothetical protein
MNEEKEKPRRLEDDMVTYLTHIENRFDNDNLDEEEKLLLVENVLSELKFRTASAACDRRTNFLMEKLSFQCDLKNINEYIQRCTPYSIFLVRNRYSSHVIQV